MRTTDRRRRSFSVALAGQERILFDLGAPLAEGATSAKPLMKVEIERLFAVSLGYGVETKLPAQ
jgi:hypothetical protein